MDLEPRVSSSADVVVASLALAQAVAKGATVRFPASPYEDFLCFVITG